MDARLRNVQLLETIPGPKCGGAISDADGMCASDAPYAIFMRASRLMGKDKKGGPFVSQNCVLRCDTKLRTVARRNLLNTALQIGLLTDRQEGIRAYPILRALHTIS